MKMFNRMNWVIDGMDAKVQPVFANDVTLAIINCLKMEETKGQSYDLGGPHTYTYSRIRKDIQILFSNSPSSLSTGCKLVAESAYCSSALAYIAAIAF